MRHKPHTRPDDGQRTLTKHRTTMREEYAETGERGCGLVHAIVITNPVLHETSPSWKTGSFLICSIRCSISPHQKHDSFMEDFLAEGKMLELDGNVLSQPLRNATDAVCYC